VNYDSKVMLYLGARMTPKQQARKSTDALSGAAGWHICDAKMINEYTVPDLHGFPIHDSFVFWFFWLPVR
jgi:hypothetical protein